MNKLLAAEVNNDAFSANLKRVNAPINTRITIVIIILVKLSEQFSPENHLKHSTIIKIEPAYNSTVVTMIEYFQQDSFNSYD